MKELHTGFWWGKSKEGEHLENLGMCGRMILKLIVNKWGGLCGVD
jgi:hypothetical protein